MLNLPLLRLLQNHTIDIGLRELELLLRAGLRSLRPNRNTEMAPRGRFPDAAVVALSQNCLRDLQHVTQPLVLDDRALVHFG